MGEGLVYANSDHAEPESMSAVKPAAAEPLTSAETNTAAVLFPEKIDPIKAAPEAIPDAVKKLREGDTEGRMFSPQVTFKDTIKPEDWASGEGVTPEHKEAATHELREMFNDFALSVPEAREVVALAKQNALTPPTDEQEAAWAREAETQLIAQYGGVEGAKAALKLANELLARDPRAAKMLQGTRLTNHPRTVLVLTAKARSEKLRGRL